MRVTAARSVVVSGVVVLLIGRGPGVLGDEHDHQREHDGAGDQRGQQAGLDVVDVLATDEEAQQDAEHRRQQDDLHRAGHRSAQPVTMLAISAQMKTVGAKRSAKSRPKNPACIAMSLRSTIGPTTMKAS